MCRTRRLCYLQPQCAPRLLCSCCSPAYFDVQSFCGFCCSQHAPFVPYYRKEPRGYVSLVRVCCACCSVIQFKEVFLTPYHLAIVMEFAPGGDMFQFVKASGGLKV